MEDCECAEIRKFLVDINLRKQSFKLCAIAEFVFAVEFFIPAISGYCCFDILYGPAIIKFVISIMMIIAHRSGIVTRTAILFVCVFIDLCGFRMIKSEYVNIPMDACTRDCALLVLISSGMLTISEMFMWFVMMLDINFKSFESFISRSCRIAIPPLFYILSKTLKITKWILS